MTLRWCARWAWFAFLLVGAAQPPPVHAQTPIPATTLVIHWTATNADSVTIAAPALVQLAFYRDATGAHVACLRARRTRASLWAYYTVRWQGDTLHHWGGFVAPTACGWR